MRACKVAHGRHGAKDALRHLHARPTDVNTRSAPPRARVARISGRAEGHRHFGAALRRWEAPHAHAKDIVSYAEWSQKARWKKPRMARPHLNRAQAGAEAAFLWAVVETFAVFYCTLLLELVMLPLLIRIGTLKQIAWRPTENDCAGPKQSLFFGPFLVE